jgi:hypothetical protein
VRIASFVTIIHHPSMNCRMLYVKRASFVQCQLMILKGSSSKRVQCISTHACHVHVSRDNVICVIICMWYGFNYMPLNKGGLFLNCSHPKSPYIQALHWKLFRHFRLSGPFDHRSLEDIPRFSTFQVQIARRWYTNCVSSWLNTLHISSRTWALAKTLPHYNAL